MQLPAVFVLQPTGRRLLRLDSVTDGEIADIPEDVKQRVDSLLQARRGREYYFNYEAGLRKRAEADNEIKIYEENL